MATSRILISAIPLLSAFLCAFFLAAAAWPREAASPSACQAATAQPAIANAKAALDRDPSELRAYFNLADAWSDAGCFNDAMQVLQNAKNLQSGNKELETRLRVARSLVGEEHFFDNLDRANDEAKLKRDIFRCSSLSDLEACSEAVRLKSDDPVVLVAQGDALVREKRPADALSRYRHAAALAPNQPDIAAKITAAEAQLSPPQTPAQAAPAQTNSATLAGGGTVEAPHLAATHIGGTAARNTAPDLRVASADATPVRRYSNAAPEARSH